MDYKRLLGFIKNDRYYNRGAEIYHKLNISEDKINEIVEGLEAFKSDDMKKFSKIKLKHPLGMLYREYLKVCNNI